MQTQPILFISKQMSSIENDLYYFDFKFIYSSIVVRYGVRPNICIKNFIEDITNRVKEDFEINDNEEIEIFEAGQFQVINNIIVDAELAPRMRPSDLTIRGKYGHRYATVAFYIRTATRMQMITDNVINEIRSPIMEEPEEEYVSPPTFTLRMPSECEPYEYRYYGL